MTIIELIETIGVDNIFVQPLNECVTNITLKKNGDSTVTFLTNKLKPIDLVSRTSQYTGLVLWVPSEKIPKP